MGRYMLLIPAFVTGVVFGSWFSDDAPREEWWHVETVFVSTNPVVHGQATTTHHQSAEECEFKASERRAKGHVSNCYEGW